MNRMEIIAAQVHMNQLVSNWKAAPLDDLIATGIQAMDAVGVDKVLIGESHGFTAKMLPMGEELPNGAVRTTYPFSERAVELHPDRFVYHVRVDSRDPELERILSEVRSKPGAL